MSTEPDRYMWPKELRVELARQKKLSLSLEFIYAIRRASEQQMDGTFIAGAATVAGLTEWLRTHPGFRVSANKRERSRTMSFVSVV